MADDTVVAAPAVQEPTPEQLEAMWNEESARRADLDATAESPQATPAAPAEATPAAPLELPEELKVALKSVNDLKALVGNLQHQVRTSDGRVSALQSELAQARTAATQTTGRAPNDQAVRAASQTPEKWETLKKEFPEWGEAVEALVDTVRTQPAPPVDLTPLQAEIQGSINKIVQDFHWAVEEAKLFGAYRHYKQLVNEPSFREWREKQPPEIQALTASRAADDAIRMLDLYTKDRQAARDATRDVSQDRTARLAAAARPARAPAAPPQTAEGELTAEQLWAQEAARREEIRKRRV